MKFTIEIEAKTLAEAMQILYAEGVKLTTPTKDAAAPAKPPTTPPAPAPAKPPVAAPAPAPAAAAETTLTLTEVRAKLTPLMTGANLPLKPVITALINTYAPQMSQVPTDKFPELVAKAEALAVEFDNTGVVPSLS